MIGVGRVLDDVVERVLSDEVSSTPGISVNFFTTTMEMLDVSSASVGESSASVDESELLLEDEDDEEEEGVELRFFLNKNGYFDLIRLV